MIELPVGLLFVGLCAIAGSLCAVSASLGAIASAIYKLSERMEDKE